MAKPVVALLFISASGAFGDPSAADRAACGAGAVCTSEDDDTALLQYTRTSGPKFGRDVEEEEGMISSGDQGRMGAFASVPKILGISEFKRVPLYIGSVSSKVSGKLWVRSYGKDDTGAAKQSFTYRLHGLDPQCARGPSELPKSCGVRIHEGTSCEKPGKTLWNRDALYKDPWNRAAYISFDDGTQVSAGAKGLNVHSGYTAEDIKGRVLLVYDFMGMPMACTTITGYFVGFAPPTGELRGLEVSKFKRIHGYFGRLAVEGSAVLNEKTGPTDAMTGFYLSYSLNNVDNRCSKGPGLAPMSCGIRLHDATTCSDVSSLGSVLFKTQAFEADPWRDISYRAMPYQSSYIANNDADPLNIGVTPEDIAWKVLVVYDFVGQPAACGQVRYVVSHR